VESNRSILRCRYRPWCWRRCMSRTSFPVRTASGPVARLIRHYYTVSAYSHHEPSRDRQARLPFCRICRRLQRPWRLQLSLQLRRGLQRHRQLIGHLSWREADTAPDIPELSVGPQRIVANPPKEAASATTVRLDSLNILRPRDGVPVVSVPG
jgi:hypothetical protein